MKLFACVFFIAAVCISCSDPEEEKNTPADPQALVGTWHLKNVSGTLLGVDIDYSQGEVSWNFHLTNRVLIENNITSQGPENLHAGFPTGWYEYLVRTTDKKMTLIINGVEVGEVLIDNDVLHLVETVNDGYHRTLQR